MALNSSILTLYVICSRLTFMMDHAQNVRKASGPGLTWSNDELLALASAASNVCMDPAVGFRHMKMGLGTCTRSALFNDNCRSGDAYTTEKDGSSKAS